MGRGSVVGETLVNDPDVAAISFTGSVGTGRAHRRQGGRAAWRKVQLEMGGKNPLVVLDDADLPTAVNVAVQGAYFSTGQRCTASSRLIVTAGIHDRFVAAMTDKLKTLKVDDALAAGTDIGPVVDQSQLEQDLRYLEIGESEGARSPAAASAHARDTGLLPVAGAVHRREQRDAHRPRGDLRAGGLRHPGQGLRRGAGARQRHGVRAVLGHRHHIAQVRVALQAATRRRAW